jgi:hypothetical protein
VVEVKLIRIGRTFRCILSPSTRDLKTEDESVSVRRSCVDALFHFEHVRIHIQWYETDTVRENLVYDDCGVVPYIDVFNGNSRNL